MVVLFFPLFIFLYFFFFIYFFITEHTSIFNSAPLMITFVGFEMQVGHIQIILSDHVSLKIQKTYIKLDFSATRPGY